ncbi:hypothetical protein [Sphingobacterium spiritivorum]|uniref:hypothetical protein n=1 Tax=Sphingobacterium spiritivorum TaxID=258 RepID=UPI003DA4713E
MDLSIGEIIAADIKKMGLSVTHIAQQIGMSRKGLTDILKRDDMSLSQMGSLSKLLGKDYFSLYKEKQGLSLNQEKLNNLLVSSNSIVKAPEMTFTINIAGNFDLIGVEISSLIKVIREEVENRGLYLK